MTHIVLVGNPNCGKTTLFNALTGENQRVGNWPGVTVEKKTGQFHVANQNVDITDLPGLYSLVASTHTSSQDALITSKAVIQDNVSLIMNVVDACHLERHLYLTSQLLELKRPLILAVNMTDIAQQRGITIDAQALSRELKCPVVLLQAHKQKGIDELKTACLQLVNQQGQPLTLSLPSHIKKILTSLDDHLQSNGLKPSIASYYAYRIAEGDTTVSNVPSTITDDLSAFDADIVIADARYQAIHAIVLGVQHKQSDASEHFTAKVDAIVLHRFLALPIFFTMMYLLFLFAIHVGGIFQDCFDITTDAVFVQGSAWLLQQMNAPAWLIALCANGIGKGINTTLTFIPVMASMYFFLSWLEASGYMARAAFVVDKVMRLLGLPGQSFVPMIVGFGCNVPAIMASRTLESQHDRLLTVLMSPFMSCSARLAIYTVFVAAFFPTGGQNIVFSLYLMGILMAVLTGFVLRKTLLQGQSSALILELPAYHRPSFRRLFKETNIRLRYFIVRAGKLIIPVCVLLGGLNAWMIPVHHETQSVLALFGQLLTPLFAPMGIHQDNWPATVGLLTGALAKEVVVGSLNSLYAQMLHLSQTVVADFNLLDSLKTAFLSIVDNVVALGEAFRHPITGGGEEERLLQPIYGVMYERFDGKAGAYAYLLFILLYVPCVSTIAAIRQESNRQLMWFSIGWSFFVAYLTAVAFYQLATSLDHVGQSIAYLSGFVLLLLAVKRLIDSKRLSYALSTS